MTDTPHRKKTSSKSRSASDLTNWSAIGIAAAVSVVLVAMMGYAAFCPWSPFAGEQDVQGVAERLQKVGSVVIGEPAPEEEAAPEEAAQPQAEQADGGAE